MEQIMAMLILLDENGGWYRDRTCDPYHVKVCRAPQHIEISIISRVKVPVMFPIYPRQSRAITGENRAHMVAPPGLKQLRIPQQIAGSVSQTGHFRPVEIPIGTFDVPNPLGAAL